MAHSKTNGGRFRSTAEREADYLFIEPLYARGVSMREIARRMNDDRPYSLTFQQIAKDVRVILGRWQASCIKDIDELRSAELMRLSVMESEAWAAWEQSKTTAENTTTSQESGGLGGTKTKAEIKRIKREPDPRYLDIVRYCIDKRCKMLGLDAPVKLAQTTPDGRHAAAGVLSVDEILIRYAGVLSGESEDNQQAAQ